MYSQVIQLANVLAIYVSVTVFPTPFCRFSMEPVSPMCNRPAETVDSGSRSDAEETSGQSSSYDSYRSVTPLWSCLIYNIACLNSMLYYTS